MPSWVKLDQQLPLSLRNDAASIAIQVWRTVGGVFISSLDSWAYTAHCSYMPNPDGSPAVVIINCVEGEDDQPEKRTKYMVDLTRRRVKNKDDDTYAPIPANSNEAVNRIVSWVRGLPERKAAAAHAEQEKIQDAKERRQRAVLQRQLEHDEAVEA